MDLRSTSDLVNGIPQRPILFASMPNCQTWLKCAILLEALNVDYDLVVLAGAKDQYTEWYQKIHPQQYIPALLDQVDGKRIVLWDSSSILMYLCDRYDEEKLWVGKSYLDFRAETLNWSFFHACSFFPLAKLWLQLDTRPENQRNIEMEETLHHELKIRFGLLNERLSQPGQRWLGHPDRPTIADIVSYPFAEENTSNRLGLPLKNWPALEEWRKRTSALAPVKAMYDRLDDIVPTI